MIEKINVKYDLESGIVGWGINEHPGAKNPYYFISVFADKINQLIDEVNLLKATCKTYPTSAEKKRVECGREMERDSKQLAIGKIDCFINAYNKSLPILVDKNVMDAEFAWRYLKKEWLQDSRDDGINPVAIHYDEGIKDPKLAEVPPTLADKVAAMTPSPIWDEIQKDIYEGRHGLEKDTKLAESVEKIQEYMDRKNQAPNIELYALRYWSIIKQVLKEKGLI